MKNQIIQRFLRHSTLMRTVDRYGQTFRSDGAAAIAKLPDIHPSRREVAKATGTDGARMPDNVSADCLAIHVELTGCSVDSGGREARMERATKNSQLRAQSKPRKSHRFRQILRGELSKTERAGFEPAEPV